LASVKVADSGPSFRIAAGKNTPERDRAALLNELELGVDQRMIRHDEGQLCADRVRECLPEIQTCREAKMVLRGVIVALSRSFFRST